MRGSVSGLARSSCRDVGLHQRWWEGESSPVKVSVGVKLKGERSQPAAGEGEPTVDVETTTHCHRHLDMGYGVWGMEYGVWGMGITSCSGLPLAMSALV